MKDLILPIIVGVIAIIAMITMIPLNHSGVNSELIGNPTLIHFNNRDILQHPGQISADDDDDNGQNLNNEYDFISKKIVQYKPEEALTLLQQQNPSDYEQNVQNSQHLTYEAAAHLEKYKFNSAEEKLTQAIALDPGNYKARYWQIWLYGSQHNEEMMDSAIVACKNIASGNSPEEKLYRGFCTGLYNNLMGVDIGDSVPLIEEAIQEGADAQKGYYNLGYLEAVYENWQEGIDYMTLSIQEDSGVGLAYYYRGRMYGRLGQEGEMLMDFFRGVALLPDYTLEYQIMQTFLNVGQY